jgi:putative methyltransferase (TIGR04325 family)
MFPPVRALLRARYARTFQTERAANAWHGSFSSFAEASRAAPSRLPLGYDNQAGATIYDDLAPAVGAKDYPVLYWLSRIVTPSCRIFDLGGHIGLLYHSYRRYLPIERVQWVVYDVPAVVKAGAARARAKGTSELDFTDEFHHAGSADIILASGSLQYVETPFAEMLAGLSQKPNHVIVNKLPTQDHREIITLQNIGVAYCPYRIAARGTLIGSLAALGYELVDEWENPDPRTELPYNDEASPVTWRGYYYRLRRASAG